MSRAVLRDSQLLTGRAGGITYYRNDKTEAYVEIPPAFMITDSDGATWTFGQHYVQRGWVFEFSVMRNDVDTGEMAYKIVYQRGKVRIYGQDGNKVWTGRCFL